MNEETKHLQQAAEGLLKRIQGKAPASMKAELQQLEAVINALQSFQIPGYGTTVARNPGRLTHMGKASEAIQSVLLENGSPMMRDEIVRRVLDGGWGLDNQNPSSAIKTALTQHLEGKRHKRNWPTFFVESEDGFISLVRWIECDRTQS